MIETYELLKNKDKNIKIYLENNVLAKKIFIDLSQILYY